MPAPLTLLTPMDLSATSQAGPRVYRKQVLAKRTIDYPLPGGGTRRVVFDDAYLTDLADAYKAGAYDLVPFQLADPNNAHNEDPHRYGGKVLGAEVTPDGLDLILELADDTAALVEKTGRRLGVSARIKEQLEHVDGRKFKRAIRHVLGTLDPRMQGLRPWEPIDLSEDDGGVVVDLSAYGYQGDTMTRPTIDLSALSPVDAEAFESFALANGMDVDLSLPADPAPDPEPDTDGDSGEGEDLEGDAPDADTTDQLPALTDEEVDAMLDAAVADMLASGDPLEDEQPEPVSLSNDPADVLDMTDVAGTQVDAATDTTQVARRRAAKATFDLAVERYGAAGVPPYVLDLARPVLELDPDDTNTLELSSPATGDPIDVRGIVVGLLDAFRGTVDLSTETGHGHENPDGDATEDAAAAWTEYLRNN